MSPSLFLYLYVYLSLTFLPWLSLCIFLTHIPSSPLPPNSQPWIPTKAFPHPLSCLSYRQKWSAENYYSYQVVDRMLWFSLEHAINKLRINRFVLFTVWSVWYLGVLCLLLYLLFTYLCTHDVFLTFFTFLLVLPSLFFVSFGHFFSFC
jgi:uncharacterized integral membrane protein